MNTSIQYLSLSCNCTRKHVFEIFFPWISPVKASRGILFWLILSHSTLLAEFSHLFLHRDILFFLNLIHAILHWTQLSQIMFLYIYTLVLALFYLISLLCSQHTVCCVCQGQIQRGCRGDSSPPYTHKTHGYPRSTLFNFFTMNDKLKVSKWLEVEETV